MIYKNENDWKPHPIPLGKQNMTILNVSCLQNLTQIIEKRAKQININPIQLKERYQDALIDCLELKRKINLLILPYSCFKRTFKPLYNSRQNKQEDITPYKYLVQKYDVQFPISAAISVNQNQKQHQTFLQQYKNGNFKYIRVITFNLHHNKLKQEFLIMRKIVKQTFDESKKIKMYYNINLTIKNGSQLNIVRDQLVLNQYPIEYISVTHNFLNMFPYSDQYKILYHYNQILKKTLPCGLINIFQTYYPTLYEKQMKFKGIQEELEFYYKIISLINKKNNEGTRTYKKAYNSGASIPECLLAYLIKKFELTESQHFAVKAQMERLGFQNLNTAIQGQYKVKYHNFYQKEN